MKYRCNASTDLADLLGHEEHTAAGVCFHYGPLAQAMRNNEELVLENSAALSQLLLTKVRLLIADLILTETAERIRPGTQFRLTLA